MIGTLLVVVTALAAFALLALRHRFAFVALLAMILLLQNPLTMLALRLGIVPIERGEAFLVVKEIVALLGILVTSGALFTRAVVTGRVRLGTTERWILVFVVYVAVAAVLSDAPSLVANLAGVRSLVLLPGLFLLGLWLGGSERDARRIRNLVIGIAVALAVFGLIEAYLLPDSFWLAIGQEEYYLMKRGRPIQGLLYGNMRYWFDGNAIRRVASITGDPLISSYPMAFALWLLGAYAIIARRARRSLVPVAWLVAVALLLTISRGAFLTLLLAGVFLVLSRHSARFFTLVTTLAYTGAIAVALAFGDQILNLTYGEGHLEQLRRGLAAGLAHPFGIGTGTAGATVAGLVAAAGNALRVGADSFTGSTAIQIGLVGLVLCFIVMLAIASELYRVGTAHDPVLPRWWHLATATFMGGLLVVSTVNESGYGFIANGLLFVWAGILVSIERAGQRSRVATGGELEPGGRDGSALEPAGARSVAGSELEPDGTHGVAGGGLDPGGTATVS